MTNTNSIEITAAAQGGGLIHDQIPSAHGDGVVRDQVTGAPGGGMARDQTPPARGGSFVRDPIASAHHGSVAHDLMSGPAAGAGVGWAPAVGRPIMPETQPDLYGETSAAVRRTVAICDTQPVVAEGVRTLLGGNEDLRFLETTDSLRNALDRIHLHKPDVILVDKAFGIQAILDWLSQLRPALESDGRPGVVVWGVSISEAEALRFLQAGARGILRKTAPVQVVLACLRTIAAGRSWMEESVFRDLSRSERYPRSELTAREQQVLELVEQGFKNKDIGQELGIRPGTVKIHLKHIFEKTGVRGRYGLALNGLKERTIMTMPAQATGR